MSPAYKLLCICVVMNDNLVLVVVVECCQECYRSKLDWLFPYGIQPISKISYMLIQLFVLVLLVHEVANMNGHLGEPTVPIFYQCPTLFKGWTPPDKMFRIFILFPAESAFTVVYYPQ